MGLPFARGATIRMKFSLRAPKVQVYAYAQTAIGLLLLLGGLFFAWDLISTTLKEEKKATESRKKAEPTKSKRSLLDYRSILEKNPFGFPGGELKPISPSPSPSSEVSVAATDILLVGTVAGPPQESYAIFSDHTGYQEVFGVGASVFGVGRLDRVEKDRAFILQQGKEIEVSLVDIAAVREWKGAPRERAGPAKPVRPTGPGSFMLDQKMVSEAVENPNQVMTEARLLPNLVDGKQQGFLLSEVKPGGIYESLGLQDGDVLLRINQGDISSPESALQALSALKGMDRVQMDVMRNGVRMTLTYQIR
jgi:general secretion pathway protein C